MNSYRAPTTDLTRFKPMFHFYTLYTHCKNKKTFELLMLPFGEWVGDREMKHWLETG